MTVEEACSRFPALGAAHTYAPLAGGHIHRTWRVGSSTGRWIVQACNPTVFPDLEAVMANVASICPVLDRRLCPVATAGGSTLWRDGDGVPWRARPWIDGAPPAKLTVATAAALGAALGRWHRRLAAVDPGSLAITLPGFHDPAARLAGLSAVPAPASLGPVVASLRSFAWLAGAAAAMQPPSVPLRVAHFDAKADNFLIDADGQVAALIDLDTVMPGSILWDVGDLLRSATATQPEDVPDGMAFDAARAGAILSAYRDAAGDLLTEAERSALPLAGPVVTFEQAVRFLADHLAGDAYYRVGYRGHNLDRARAQLLLLEGMVEMVR